jgi:magnesium chelatase family protein
LDLFARIYIQARGMIARLKTIGLSGLDTFDVEVEVTVRSGKPYYAVIGLGDGAVKESKERVQSAIVQSRFSLPEQIVVNLAPADVKKEGASFDLAIALGILICTGQLDAGSLEGVCVLGELALDGGIKYIRGALTLVIGVKPEEFDRILIPETNLAEASLMGSQGLIGVRNLKQVVSYLKSGVIEETDFIWPENYQSPEHRDSPKSFNQVWGQDVAKRALSIAAAGGHNLLMVGPPGCGKSMLAERFSTILPEPTRQETIEMVSIHSAMGMDLSDLISGSRPFRSPHHSISEAGLIGGGTNVRAGEITLSHGGVLFLDELPEFRRTSIEALRSPLESGKVTVSRAKYQRTFPAAFQLIAAMNPCPCGKFGYGKGKQSCLCGNQQIQKYLSKLSFPIIERIDLQVELEEVPLNVLAGGINKKQDQSFNSWQDQVRAARIRQLKRSTILNYRLNSEQLKSLCNMNESANSFFIEACSKLEISARSFVRLLRVARTIADLDDKENVREVHLAEALSYRALSRIWSKVKN